MVYLNNYSTLNEQIKLTKKERRELRRQEKIKEQLGRKRKRLYRRIALWPVLFLGIGGAIFGMAKLVSQTSPSSNVTTPLVNSVAESDWVKGNKESNVTLVEYSDFQCPACGSYSPIVKQLVAEFGDDIQFIYRHFPLRQIHPNADLAARAAEATGRQDKFWEMHDMIFKNQKEWSDQRNAEDYFIKYAENLNLDIERFKNDLDLKDVKDKVEKDYKNGVSLGVNATPTFFLNGEKLRNPRTYDEFKSLIQQAISSSNQENL